MRRIVLAALTVLLCSGAAHAAPGYAPGVLLVRWRTPVRSADRAAVRQVLGATAVREFAAIGVEKLSLATLTVEEAVLRLAQDPRVEFAEPDHLVGIARTPDDPRFGEQWALQNTGQSGGVAGADARAVRGWDIATDASAVIVGVVDTGADLLHPELQSELWVNPGEVAGNGIDDDANGYVDDVHGFDFLNHDSDPSDDNGHGSHVAGIIAARGDDGVGITGIAWRGRLMVLKFLGASGTGPTSAAIEAILYASRMGARIVNHSWGGGPYSQALVAAFQSAGEAGGLSVVAAGNNGLDLEVQPTYPASFDDPHLITVAATDHRDELAPFSNRGVVSVDVGAPGADILSLAPGGQYQVLSGTSMAAPLVAGALALLLAREPALDPVALRQRLLASAWPLPALHGRTVSGGRLDLVRLLAEPEDEPPSAVAELRLERVGSHAAWLAWTAPGDDGDVGRADRYLLRISSGPVGAVPFEAMTPVPASDPAQAGMTERLRIGGLDAETRYWVMIRATDDLGNGSPLVGPLEFTTQPPPRAELDAARVGADLPPGASERREVRLSNPSQGTLEWRFSPSLLATGAPGSSAAAGYRVAGLGEGAAPRFDWQAPGAEAVVLTLEGDEGLSGPIALPFRFPFFGQEYTEMRVSSNGFVTFLGDQAAPQPVALPSSLAPPAMVAPFWADLDPGPSARRVSMQADPLRVIITWQETSPFGSPGSLLTFQLWLLRTGEVRFQYLTLSGRSALASAGLQAAAAGAGVRLAFRDARLVDSLAVRMLPPRTWARATPISGVLGPGESTPIAIDFDSRGLEDGIEEGALTLLSDDPATPALPVVARLTARGAPHVVTSHSWLDFGMRPLARDAVRSLGIANEGARAARVHGLESRGDDAFAVSDLAFDLAPGEARTIPVRFHPTQRGEQLALLSVVSDDPQAPRADIALAGQGLEVARLRLSDAAIRGAAATGVRAGVERDAHTLTIANSGGMPLPWRLEALAESRPVETIAGRTAPPASSGGPDPAGYRWTSSDEPGAPQFDWWEIEGVGRRLFGAADDSVNVGLPLPFTFPFYGREFGGISVCTNGWMAFESSVPLRNGRILPDPAAPLGLIAPFWTDLDARNTANQGGIYAHSDDERFVVEWKDVRRFGGAERFSFQVWLWRDGRIDFLYRSMAGARTGATIGLQDADGQRGLTAAHGTALARDSLRLSFRTVPTWLSASHYAGILPPGGTDTLRLALTADGLAQGRWAGALRFLLAGSDTPTVSLPCTLVAGATALGAQLHPRRLLAASETPFVDLEIAAPLPDAGALWWDDRLLVPSVAEPLAAGRLRLRFEAERVLSGLPAGDRVRRLASRDERSGWRVADVPLEIVLLPFDVQGLPPEGEDEPFERAVGERQPLTWRMPAGATLVQAWLRTAPGEWERIASSASDAMTLTWPRAIPLARLELVATSDTGIVGVWRSSDFAIRRADAPALPAQLALSLTGAHPARAPVVLELALPAGTDVLSEVFDTRGARIRELAHAPFVAGRHSLVWDGRGTSGERAAPGVYLVRARTASGEVTRRVVLLGRP